MVQALSSLRFVIPLSGGLQATPWLDCVEGAGHHALIKSNEDHFPLPLAFTKQQPSPAMENWTPHSLEPTTAPEQEFLTMVSIQWIECIANSSFLIPNHLVRTYPAQPHNAVPAGGIMHLIKHCTPSEPPPPPGNIMTINCRLWPFDLVLSTQHPNTNHTVACNWNPKHRVPRANLLNCIYYTRLQVARAIGVKGRTNSPYHRIPNSKCMHSAKSAIPNQLIHDRPSNGSFTEFNLELWHKSHSIV